MPYATGTRAQKRYLVRDRWFNADLLFQWAISAREARINVLTERETLRAQLDACKQVFDQQLGNDAILVDSVSPVWMPVFQKINGMLSDRSQQAGASTDQQGNAVAPTRTLSSATQRAWQTSIDEMINWINADKNVVDKTTFETVCTWNNA